jgi:DnaK suppressor protein
MFVSLLQLMGFSTAPPGHPPAEEIAPPKAAKTQGQSAKESDTPVFAPKDLPKIARRVPVKAPAVKPKAVSVKAVVATKPTPAAKSAKAQPAAKVPVAKAPVAKKVESAAKAKPAKAVSAAAPIPPRSKKKVEPVTTIDPIKTESSSKTAKVVKPAPVAPPMTPLGVPVRSGRPSSRLAQLTVPSMAQSVASTAAKASFTQMTTVQPIVSPLASAIKKDPKLADNWKKKPVAELSDAEIMAMSDDNYMNDTQMAFFRYKLVVLKNEILSNAGETTEHLREDTVVVPDPADRATIEEEHALELRTRDRERKLLKKIEQSINRIDTGDYGYCDETGEPIGVGRLLARPTASLSLEAQQRR